MEHAKGIFLCEVLTREVGEGVREIGSGRGALVQAPSLCRDGLRELNAFAFDSVCRGEGIEELGVLHGGWGVFVGAPVMIPVVACSVVYISMPRLCTMNNTIWSLRIAHTGDSLEDHHLQGERRVVHLEFFCRPSQFGPASSAL